MVNELGIDNFHFAWGGGTSKGHKHYYRIHCGDFIVEYDNRQGEAITFIQFFVILKMILQRRLTRPLDELSRTIMNQGDSIFL
ncbi:MAG: hypothetical protein CM1200mP38_4630 [Dehalococcoidia bacterium]|nr:MAG: hypothetical protein CM1200mP38_4630 [Dehalococcoidia bacterium]